MNIYVQGVLAWGSIVIAVITLARFVSESWPTDIQKIPDRFKRLQNYLENNPEGNDNWATFFIKLFDKIFGKEILSPWRLFMSAVSSVIFTVLLIFVWQWINPTSFNIWWNQFNWNSLAVFIAILFFFNLLADYLSLIETRTILEWIQHTNSIFIYIFLLLFDVFLTFIIAFGFFYLLMQGDSRIEYYLFLFFFFWLIVFTYKFSTSIYFKEFLWNISYSFRAAIIKYNKFVYSFLFHDILAIYSQSLFLNLLEHICICIAIGSSFGILFGLPDDLIWGINGFIWGVVLSFLVDFIYGFNKGLNRIPLENIPIKTQISIYLISFTFLFVFIICFSFINPIFIYSISHLSDLVGNQIDHSALNTFANIIKSLSFSSDTPDGFTYGIFIYSTFLTSIWIWLFVATTWLYKFIYWLKQRGSTVADWIIRVITSTNDPAQGLGWVTIFIVTVLFMLGGLWHFFFSAPPPQTTVLLLP